MGKLVRLAMAGRTQIAGQIWKPIDTGEGDGRLRRSRHFGIWRRILEYVEQVAVTPTAVQA